MSEFIQVLTTTSTKAQAQAIADTLVAFRLAGCVQIAGPITSVYRWQGKVESAEEWVCIAKTRGDLYLRVEAEIARLHSYETPEILAVAVHEGSARYLDWLEGELVSPDGRT